MIEQILIPSAITLITALTAWFFGRKENLQKMKSMQVELSSLKVALESSKLDNEIKSSKYYQNLLDDLSARLEKAIEQLMLSEERNEILTKHIREMMTVNTELVDELQKFKQLNGKK